MSINLADKEVIITGGSRGIGKVVAQHLGDQGAKLNIIARTKSELSKSENELLAKGYKIKTFRGNVLNIREMKKIICVIGNVDILINCAGVQGEIGPFVNLDLRRWKETFEINFNGTVNCISEVLPYMLRKKSGKIINFSGGGAHYSRPNFSAYGVSKAAIVRLTEILADELRDSNIQINAVSPGTIKTKMIDEILEAGSDRVGDEHERVRDKLEEGFDSPDLVAELICYLVSEESDWLSGKVISAVWDPWKEWMDNGPAEMDQEMYTLRRIDGRNVVKVYK